jgi:FO synthase
VSPLTPDHVNPERPWPNLDSLAEITAATGYTLTERITAQPRYVLAGSPWIDPGVAAHMSALADPLTGLAVDIRPTGRPWTPAVVSPTPPPIGSGQDVRAALRRVEADPAGAGRDDYVTLANADGAELDDFVRLADSLREQAAGDVVTYVPTRTINTAPVCEPGCRFCVESVHPALSATEVADRAWEAKIAGIGEVCIKTVPRASVADCVDYIRAIKSRVPFMRVRLVVPPAMSAAFRSGGPELHAAMIGLREAGLDSIAGVMGPGDGGVDAIILAHELGLRSTATMGYGHADNPSAWVHHLASVREIHARTGGFTDFVPLPFSHVSAPVPSVAATKPAVRDSRAVHALARVMLHGRITTIGTSPAGLGIPDAQLMLRCGASDVGGTSIEETIARSTGSHHGLAWTVREMQAMAGEIGRTVGERNAAGVRDESAA